MRTLGIMLSVAVFVVLMGSAAAQENKTTNKEKIVGIWECTKLPRGTAFPRLIDYPGIQEDAKITTKVKVGDKDIPPEEGMYSVDGDKITVTHMVEGKEKTTTYAITKLTAKELVTTEKKKDDPDQILEFKRK